MNILLDTHFVVWSAIDPRRLNARERALLERSDSTLLCSAVSIWELRLKWHSFAKSGARKGSADPTTVLRYALDVGWSLLDLTPDHAMTALETPLDHTDPFDELLLVQAQVEGLRLLTRDAKLLAHPLTIR